MEAYRRIYCESGNSVYSVLTIPDDLRVKYPGESVVVKSSSASRQNGYGIAAELGSVNGFDSDGWIEANNVEVGRDYVRIPDGNVGGIRRTHSRSRGETGNPAVNEVLDHHSERSSPVGSSNKRPVALNRKPGVSKGTSESIAHPAAEIKQSIRSYRNGVYDKKVTLAVEVAHAAVRAAALDAERLGLA